MKALFVLLLALPALAVSQPSGMLQKDMHPVDTSGSVGATTASLVISRWKFFDPAEAVVTQLPGEPGSHEFVFRAPRTAEFRPDPAKVDVVPAKGVTIRFGDPREDAAAGLTEWPLIVGLPATAKPVRYVVLVPYSHAGTKDQAQLAIAVDVREKLDYVPSRIGFGVLTKGEKKKVQFVVRRPQPPADGSALIESVSAPNEVGIGDVGSVASRRFTLDTDMCAEGPYRAEIRVRLRGAGEVVLPVDAVVVAPTPGS